VKWKENKDFHFLSSKHASANITASGKQKKTRRTGELTYINL
jgi:hypothetical protein